MPSYKLSYFNGRGLGEVPRQLFHLSGTPFEDNRVPEDKWPEFRSTTPFGRLPVLEIDGTPLPQSNAIARFLAREFGYSGKTNFEAAWVDAIADQYNDYFSEIRPFFQVMIGLEQGDKDKLQKEVAEPARDKFFALMTKVFENSKSGYMIGDSLTWADLILDDHIDLLLFYLPNFLDSYPKMVDLCKNVQSCPKLKEWLDKRPVTRF